MQRQWLWSNEMLLDDFADRIRDISGSVPLGDGELIDVSES